MKLDKFMGIFLGFLTAAGGFIDISNLVFNPQASSKFSYTILWPVLIGVIGIAIYSEMSGRVAAIAKKPVFDLIRERTGFTAALITLIAACLVNVLTCAAEVGGVAIVFQMLTGRSYMLMTIAAFLILLVSTWIMKFKWIEWVYGILGLCMLVYVANAFSIHPDWKQVASGLIPTIPSIAQDKLALYSYFVIGLFSSVLMPYQVYFYSSGGIEEGWGKEDLIVNKITAYLGYGLGALIAIAISIVSAKLFYPVGIYPQLVETALLGPISVYGKVGLYLALIGVLFAIGGTAVETALAGSYSVSQFFGWHWGKYQKPSKAPRFTIGWMVVFILAFLILLTGVDPIQITEYAVVFSVVVFPLTYFPILLLANDTTYMDKFRNGKFFNILAWIYAVIILIVAISAIPLLIMTQGGQAG